MIHLCFWILFTRLMFRFLVNGHTIPTCITMESKLFAAYTAKFTLFTMIHLFFKIVIVQEFAVFTVVSCKLELTINASLSDRLFFPTLETFASRHLEAFQRMSLLIICIVVVFSIIMTNTARVEFQTFWTLFVATPFVVFATVRHFWVFIWIGLLLLGFLIRFLVGFLIVLIILRVILMLVKFFPRCAFVIFFLNGFFVLYVWLLVFLFLVGVCLLVLWSVRR